MLEKNIAVIGCGGIGSRHFQSLASVSQPINIFAVDLSREALASARARLAEKRENSSIVSENYSTRISDLPEQLDIVIIATNSDKRYDALAELLTTSVVKNLILEKVVFPSRKQCEDALALLLGRNIESWVNTPNRAFIFYQHLRSMLSRSKPLTMVVDGGDWGMACNAIHYIDLFSYLTGHRRFQFNVDQIDPEIYQSKRLGYLEIGGELELAGPDGSNLRLIDDKRSTRPVVLTFVTTSARAVVLESEQRAFVQTEDESWVWREQRCPIPFQSDLTANYVRSILDGEDMFLPTLSESIELHMPFLDCCSSVIGERTMKQMKTCPIT